MDEDCVYDMWDRCAKWGVRMRSTETCGKTLFKSFLNVGKSLLNTQTHSVMIKQCFFIVLQEDRSSQTMEESLLKC